MKFRNLFSAALASSALLIAAPAIAQDVDDEIAALVATCSVSPTDCAAAIQAFNLRRSAVAAPVLTVAQLGRVQEAVNVASVNAPAPVRQAVRQQLAAALQGAVERTANPPAPVVAAVSTAVTNLSAGRAPEQEAGDPDPASPT
ncbi:MAG: hypothetical protein JJT99_04725 [Rhodobacteraceae bacterium]|nr:hypothetical protein [Paracoccaceae bacterium]